ALAELKKAIQVDPVNQWVNETLADVNYYLRDYDEAIAQYLKTLELYPHSRVIHLKLSDVYRQQDREDEEILSINRYFLAMRDTVLLNLFMKTYKEHGYKRAIMSWIKAWEPYGKGKGAQSTSIALLYMRIGDYEKNYEWLQNGYDLRNKDMILIGVRPIYDDLRSDARFLVLLDKIGLPH
ncbi:tetratricopeptide repeat protein, partial [Candidatus Neomarinimicrobiota bacterium]